MSSPAANADLHTLQALLREREAKIVRLEQTAEVEAQQMALDARGEKLDHDIQQLEMRLEELQADAGAASLESPARPATPRTPSERVPLPPHLPRDVGTHLPQEVAACAECGGTMKWLGEDMSEQLEYVPARFKVIRHVQPKYACACCDRIAQAPAPTRPIARGLAAPGLLAHVFVAKYCDHPPLYRQSVMYAREAVTLERATMAEWVGAASSLLTPLVETIHQHVMRASNLHADDTAVAVLAPGRGKTKTGCLWVYVRDDGPAAGTAAPSVWFAYTENRRGNHPQQHLAHYHGTIQADAYGGYQAIYDTGRVVETACWPHARSKFYELEQSRPSPVTAEPLRRIGEWCAIEVKSRGKPRNERQRIRQDQEQPLLNAMEAWLRTTMETLLRKSDTTAAILYALDRL
jgi:transposase